MTKESINPLELKLTGVFFSNDKSMFCICHNQGFLVCKTSPFAILNNRILWGEISIAQIVDKSNRIFLACSGGKHPRYPLTHLIIYDNESGKPVEQIQIGHRIKNIKANKKLLFVVGRSKIFLFKTENLSNIGTFDSYEENEEGICALSENDEEVTFAYPARTEGYINIMRIKDKIIDIKNFFIHNKKIACLGLNKTGDKLISSSIGGTLIRLFDTKTGDIIDDFKRGNNKAQIFSLNFSNDNKFICCSSDKETIHIFKLNEYEQNSIDELNKVVKKLGKDILDKKTVNRQHPFNNSKSRKFAFFKANEETSYLSFSENDTISIISINDGGKYYKICFDQNQGGEAKVSEVFNILCKENLLHLSN